MYKREINENEDYDILDVYLDDRLTRAERDIMINIGIISKSAIYPSFYFDNKRLNKNFRNYGIVKTYRTRNDAPGVSFFKKFQFYQEDYELLLEGFSRK
jgi:hypothetical protein